MRLDPITLIQNTESGCYAKLTHSKYIQASAGQLRADSKLYEFVVMIMGSRQQTVMPDDHSELVPLLPIPNRTVKRLSADDSAGSRVKVGHRQALTAQKPQHSVLGFLLFQLMLSNFRISSSAIKDFCAY